MHPIIEDFESELEELRQKHPAFDIFDFLKERFYEATEETLQVEGEMEDLKNAPKAIRKDKSRIKALLKRQEVANKEFAMIKYIIKQHIQ